MNILIAGDFFIADSFKNQPLIDNSVKELFAAADYRIVNLEAPLTANEPENRILKTGPHLSSSAETMLPYLKQLKVDLVTLANNHIFDYGWKGLSDTFDSLQKNKISYVGAGNTLKEASRPFTFEKEGMKIAILNFAENEWSIAEDEMPGANPLDIIDNVNQIKKTKATHDKVICIIHGGHEYYHLPSPRMVKQYRFYAENGADAIVGHHTHCIGGYEVYQDVPIIYSLGNFLFTLPSKREEWYTGLLTQLSFEKQKKISFKIMPVEQKKESFLIAACNKNKKNILMDDLENYVNIIHDSAQLNKLWNIFIESINKQHLNTYSPIQLFNNKYITAVFKKLGIDTWFMNINHYKLILNMIRCEAHFDASKKILKNFIFKIKKR